MNSPPPGDRPPDWFAADYFERRIEEEVSRAATVKRRLSLVVIRFPVNVATAVAEPERIVPALILVKSRLRTVDLAGELGRRAYCLCLPGTDEPGARAVALRAGEILREFTPMIGYAVFPIDGATVAELLSSARRRLYEASSLGRIAG